MDFWRPGHTLPQPIVGMAGLWLGRASSSALRARTVSLNPSLPSTPGSRCHS